ncbi:MAG: tetratricopeptide repeat protein [Pseudomonadota bacterium]
MRRILAVILWVASAAAAMAQVDESAVSVARLDYLDGDYDKALAVIVPAAENGSAMAQNILGDAYDKGNGVPVDAALAVEWWEKAAAQDFDRAIYNLGLHYAENGDPERAVGYYERAVAMGNDFAMNNLARLLEQGRGVDADPEGAAELYEAAIDLGNNLAINNLARMYLEGDGVDEDLAYALSLYRYGAEKGLRDSLNNLGAMYENGYGVGQDRLAAMALYKQAAEAGFGRAAINLAEILIYIDNGWNDPLEGYRWCLRGLALGGIDVDPDDCDAMAEVVGPAIVAEAEASVAD